MEIYLAGILFAFGLFSGLDTKDNRAKWYCYSLVLLSWFMVGITIGICLNSLSQDHFEIKKTYLKDGAFK